MTATHATDRKNLKGFNRNQRKENHFYKEYLVITPALNQVITCRLYATNATHYCAIWVSATTRQVDSGTGQAGGYGYHRESAAVAEAIRNAGYVLDTSISGVGTEAIESALKAIAALEGHPEVKIFTAHA